MRKRCCPGCPDKFSDKNTPEAKLRGMLFVDLVGFVQLNVTVALQAGAGRNKLADDDVFF
jgi:hypothetical protein